MSRQFDGSTEDTSHLTDAEQGYNDLATFPRPENGVRTVIVRVGRILKVLQTAALNRQERG